MRLWISEGFLFEAKPLKPSTPPRLLYFLIIASVVSSCRYRFCLCCYVPSNITKESPDETPGPVQTLLLALVSHKAVTILQRSTQSCPQHM